MTLTHFEGHEQDPDRPEGAVEIPRGTTVIGWRMEPEWYLIQIPTYGIVSWVSREFYESKVEPCLGTWLVLPGAISGKGSVPVVPRPTAAPAWWLLALAVLMFFVNQRWLW